MPVLDATTIAVPETCQLTDNMGMKYTAYRVEVRPSPPAQQNGEGDASAPPHATTAVLRRYRDFAWLHTALSKERPGCVVPPVPEKNAASPGHQTRTRWPVRRSCDAKVGVPT